MKLQARFSLGTLASAIVLLPVGDALAARPASTARVTGAIEPSANRAPSAVAAGDDGDLVETIDPNAAPEATPRAPEGSSAEAAALPLSAPTALRSAAPPAIPDRFELHGWARQSLELGLSKRSRRSDDADRTALPYDQLTARSQLFMSARYSHERWLEADVSGALSYSLFEQAPAAAATAFNGFNGQSARGVVEPRLHELFVGFFTSGLDVRIGQQRVAWGNSEFRSPNDVMNARDLRDPFLSETALRTIPTFLLRADLDLGFATLQVDAAPVFTPDRYDVYGSNWAGIQPDAPLWARGLAGIARRSIDPTLQEGAQRLLMATRYPKGDFTDPVLGARLSWSAHNVDVNYYYQYGFDGPLLSIDPALGASLASIDFSRAGLVDLEPWLLAIDQGTPPLVARYVRRHHAGLDVATTLGPFAFRVDAAYESKRVFFRRDLVGAISPTIEAVFSAEYQTGDKDKLALVELIYLHLMDAPSTPLLIYDTNSVAIGTDLRWPIVRPLGFELRGLFGLQPRTAVIQPELNVKITRSVLSVGGLFPFGEAFSFGRYFHRNLETYAKYKLLF